MSQCDFDGSQCLCVAVTRHRTGSNWSGRVKVADSLRQIRASPRLHADTLGPGQEYTPGAEGRSDTTVLHLGRPSVPGPRRKQFDLVARTGYTPETPGELQLSSKQLDGMSDSLLSNANVLFNSSRTPHKKPNQKYISTADSSLEPLSLTSSRPVSMCSHTEPLSDFLHDLSTGPEGNIQLRATSKTSASDSWGNFSLGSGESVSLGDDLDDGNGNRPTSRLNPLEEVCTVAAVIPHTCLPDNNSGSTSSKSASDQTVPDGQRWQAAPRSFSSLSPKSSNLSLRHVVNKEMQFNTKAT